MTSRKFIPFSEIMVPVENLEIVEDNLYVLRGGFADGGCDKDSGCGCGCGCSSGKDCGCGCGGGSGKDCGCGCNGGSSGHGCGCKDV